MDIQEATKLIARHYDGAKGVWAYEAFEYVNHKFFDNKLPWPLIRWAITPHGGCLGLTRTGEDSPPIITLHPSLLGGTQKENPWGVDPALLGVTYAFDVLLHESIHVSVRYLLGGATGPTSHNNPQWLGEVNRIAPLIGLEPKAGVSKARRVTVTDGDGKPASKVIRGVEADCYPFKTVATFPGGVRTHLNQADYYLSKSLPFPSSL